MPQDHNQIGDPPRYITCDPLSRVFPAEWKDIWFRRQATPDENGVVNYTCPICGRKFDHTMIDYLQGDHVWPHSLFGETSWANYQLICGSCNASKGNRLQTDIRLALGAGEFRRMVALFLREQIETGKLANDSLIWKILGIEAHSLSG